MTELALRGATLIDGTGADPVADATLVLSDDRIASIGGSVSNDATTIDLEGCTLLPGLIDAHTHLGIAFELQHHGQAGEMPAAEVAARVFHLCEQALLEGFTTCRDMGGIDGGVVQAINSGLIRGPRIFPSAAAIAQDGGHASFMAPYSDCWCPLAIPGLVEGVVVANGPDEMRLAARKAFRRGATQIKVMVSGGVISFTDELDHTQLTVEELRAVVVEAEARNTYVTAHSHNSRGIRNGLEAGVKCFEHGSWLDEETAALMAEADAALVPTLTIAHVMGTDFERFGLPPAIVQRIEQVSGHMEKAIGFAREAGVLTGAGTDLLGPQQDRRAMEIALRAEVVGAMDAIVAMTSTNAKILRADDRIGSLEPGKLADVIAVRGDPLAEPQLFTDPDRVVLVVKGGEVVKSPTTA